MKRIKLAVVRGFHQPSLNAGQRATAFRLVTRIGFALDQGWTGFDSIAIVDTGAPISLFPVAAWKSIHRHMTGFKRALLAPDKFKSVLTAPQAADAMADGPAGNTSTRHTPWPSSRVSAIMTT